MYTFEDIFKTKFPLLYKDVKIIINTIPYTEIFTSNLYENKWLAFYTHVIEDIQMYYNYLDEFNLCLEDYIKIESDNYMIYTTYIHKYHNSLYNQLILNDKLL